MQEIDTTRFPTVEIARIGEDVDQLVQQSDEYLREWAMEWRIAPLRALPVSAPESRCRWSSMV